MNAEKFGAANAVNITVLVDNHADLIVKSDDRVKYFTDKALLAEHGFSALVHFPSDPEIRILWDAGVTPVALIENLRRMEVDPGSIDQIALSHGHLDHYAALTQLLMAMDLEVNYRDWSEPVTAAGVEDWTQSGRIPVTAHPAAFRERWKLKEDGTWAGPFSPPPWQLWEALGGSVQRSEEPYRLAPGCWTTGYVPRDSFERSGRPTRMFYRQGDQMVPDDLEEDQAVVIHVKGKGLIILSGCAHAGIINTIDHARTISGVDRIYAVIGGFHLARSDSEEIQQTIEAIQAYRPQVLVPCHCTGFQAMCAFAQQMPGVTLPGVVGASYNF